MRLLVVEDDPDLNRQLVTALQDSGYVVDSAKDGEEGHYLGDAEPYDAVVLDLGLPVIDGVSVLEKWRRAGRKMPVLILTARDGVDDRIRGLDSGADDYLVKPADLHEVAARRRALVRRARGEASPQLRAGEIGLDPASREVTLRGVPVSLQPREFALLHELLLNAGRALSREQLEQRLYAWGEEVGSNAVEVHVHRLRRKLGPDAIRTVRGVGYLVAKDSRG